MNVAKVSRNSRSLRAWKAGWASRRIGAANISFWPFYGMWDESLQATPLVRQLTCRVEQSLSFCTISTEFLIPITIPDTPMPGVALPPTELMLDGIIVGYLQH